jgi:hypothetical protein
MKGGMYGKYSGAFFHKGQAQHSKEYQGIQPEVALKDLKYVRNGVPSVPKSLFEA